MHDLSDSWRPQLAAGLRRPRSRERHFGFVCIYVFVAVVVVLVLVLIRQDKTAAPRGALTRG